MGRRIALSIVLSAIVAACGQIVPASGPAAVPAPSSQPWSAEIELVESRPWVTGEAVVEHTFSTTGAGDPTPASGTVEVRRFVTVSCFGCDEQQPPLAPVTVPAGTQLRACVEYDGRIPATCTRELAFTTQTDARIPEGPVDSDCVDGFELLADKGCVHGDHVRVVAIEPGWFREPSNLGIDPIGDARLGAAVLSYDNGSNGAPASAADGAAAGVALLDAVEADVLARAGRSLPTDQLVWTGYRGMVQLRAPDGGGAVVGSFDGDVEVHLIDRTMVLNEAAQVVARLSGTWTLDAATVTIEVIEEPVDVGLFMTWSPTVRVTGTIITG